MSRRVTKLEPATAMQRPCPHCHAEPRKPCKTPSGKLFRSKGQDTVHHRRKIVPVPLTHIAQATRQGGYVRVGHIRSAERGSRAICGAAVNLEPATGRVRVSCSSCYSGKAHLLAHPGTRLDNGMTMLPLEGGIPEDAKG
jgi:hypothetical protein